MGLAASALLALSAAAAGPLDWMAGTWCTEGTAASRTCEHWEPMAGETMLGTNHTVRDGRTRGFEFMRIALDGEKAVFNASPGGAPPSPFPEAARADRRIVFANAAHDYPQRIVYWRDGDALMAEISLADGSKARQWRFVRVKD